MKRDGLKPMNFTAYSVGHVYNDLCATAWFTYLLYFLTLVLDIPKGVASLAALSGQLADGFATPAVGYLSDNIKFRWGKRTPWYVIGTVLIVPTFYGTFHKCLFCSWGGYEEPYAETCNGLLTFYYMLFPALFNVGWAAVQISNMSLVINITASQQRRDRLVSGRNAFTYIAGISILVLMSILFSTSLNPEQQFYVMVYIVTGVGCLCSLAYLFGVPELSLSKKSDYHD